MVTDPESAEVVCASCGLVSADKAIESRADLTRFESDNGRSSNNRQGVGLPNSLAFHDLGLSTLIGNQNKDSSGHTLNAYMNSSMQRLRTWDARSQSNVPGHRNLMRALNELGRLKDKLGLTSAIVEKGSLHIQKGRREANDKG